ncbi:MAG: helix-turn-helix domain-containing protein [Anaerolineae bacterium]|nr:helix-turn-helix domain-containing protein [Anaerolineae bacterium]
MSIEITKQIWTLKKLPSSQRLVLLAYAEHASNDGSGAYPSLQRVAKMTKFSVRHVQRLRDALIRGGHLVPDGVSAHGTRRFDVVINPEKRRKYGSNVTPPHPKWQSGWTSDPEGWTPESTEPIQESVVVGIDSEESNKQEIGVTKSAQALIDIGITAPVAKEFTRMPLHVVHAVIIEAQDKEKAGGLRKTLQAYVVWMLRQRHTPARPPVPEAPTEAPVVVHPDLLKPQAPAPEPIKQGPPAGNEQEYMAWVMAHQQMSLQLDLATYRTYVEGAQFLRAETVDGITRFVIGVRENARPVLEGQLARPVQRMIRDAWGRSVEVVYE